MRCFEVSRLKGKKCPALAYYVGGHLDRAVVYKDHTCVKSEQSLRMQQEEAEKAASVAKKARELKARKRQAKARQKEEQLIRSLSRQRFNAPAGGPDDGHSAARPRRDMGTCDAEISATPDSSDRGQTTAAPAPETRDMAVDTIDEFSAVLRENKFVPAIFEAEFEEDEDDEAEF